ncbi:MAG: class A beta-lactamase [Pseudomonadota bacterium]
MINQGMEHRHGVMTRRRALLQMGLGTMLAGGLVTACEKRDDAMTSLVTDLENEYEARIGLAAVDLNTWRVFAHRADDRFAMCSTFKWVLAGLILMRVDQGTLDLDQSISFTPADLLTYAPVTRQNVDAGAMTVSALCEASVTRSDNTAANLLLAQIDGPAGFTRALRDLGHTVTRLDRTEPTLNENAPGDPRDTTTPGAMIDLLAGFLFDGRGRLSAASREQLKDWMVDARTGRTRLQAGLPGDWLVGDKTGTSRNGAYNDVAFAYPPDTDNPVLMSAYINCAKIDMGVAGTLHAQLAAGLVTRFTA